MYILTHYGLILTKDRPDLSSERSDPNGSALARTSSIMNYPRNIHYTKKNVPPSPNKLCNSPQEEEEEEEEDGTNTFSQNGNN
jgi:hypothetical protein